MESSKEKEGEQEEKALLPLRRRVGLGTSAS